MIGRKKIGNQIGQQYSPKKKMPEVPPGQGPAPGQQQWGPGTQSYNASRFDAWGNMGVWEDLGVNNLADLYDLWNSGSDFSGMNEYDNFSDWYNSPYPSSHGFSQFSDAEGSFPVGDWTNSWGIGIPTNWEEQQQSYGGGATGGAGDLGTGNVFIGGGMGSSLYGEGMSGQDCATLGPSFNSAGVCIACCGEAYGEDFNPGGGSIDPNTDTACYDQYVAMQGVGGDLSYDEFAGLYC